jgi:hypothetical protein
LRQGQHHLIIYLVPALLLAGALGLQASGQSTEKAQLKKRKFVLYAGFGPNYYFDNLQFEGSLVNKINYSFVGRLMWEPEHLLSVGIESGYYRLYTVNAPAPSNARIANSAIPLHIVVSMKFLKHYYFDFSMGQSLLENRVHSPVYGDFNANSWSLADFGAALGYRHLFNQRFTLGAELKYFYSTRNVDENLAIVAVGGFRF